MQARSIWSDTLNQTEWDEFCCFAEVLWIQIRGLCQNELENGWLVEWRSKISEHRNHHHQRYESDNFFFIRFWAACEWSTQCLCPKRIAVRANSRSRARTRETMAKKERRRQSRNENRNKFTFQKAVVVVDVDLPTDRILHSVDVCICCLLFSRNCLYCSLVGRRRLRHWLHRFSFRFFSFFHRILTSFHMLFFHCVAPTREQRKIMNSHSINARTRIRESRTVIRAPRDDIKPTECDTKE